VKQGAAAFEVLSRTPLPEYRSLAVLCRHRSTGCEVLHCASAEPENLFAFIFRTPPPDDTGAPHVLEHAVLCGSRRYPLKDPFVILLRSSLQTFLNALTYPDKTVYPAASVVEKDFYNLMAVYGDAVFFPLLREEVFRQEGHRLELQEPGEPSSALKRVGVVFNEMKGVRSSPEMMAAAWGVRSLFPDTPYGLDSGGDPQAIPSLSRERLLDFHQKYYHPSNCRIFLYGNLPLEEQLEFLEERFLSRFERREALSQLPLQPRWGAPRFVEKTFPVKEGEGPAERATVILNWLTVETADPCALLAFEVLSEILVGHPGSPLQKLLLESRLGHDLAPATGLDAERREAVFSVGLRGTEGARVGEIEGIVLQELGRLRKGIPRELLEAALHQVEFRSREIRRRGRPYALPLMRRALRGWLHGADPVRSLEFDRPFRELRETLRDRPATLEALLETHLLANPHRTTLLVRPDPDQARREAEREAAALAELKAGLSPARLAEIGEQARRLKAFQEKPDPPAELDKLPHLSLADLPRRVPTIPSEVIFADLGVPVHFHDLFTNGVIYLDLALDTSAAGEELSALLPLFGRAICGCGLPGLPYDEVARRLSRVSGGLYAGPAAATGLEGGTRQHLFLGTRVLEPRLGEALPLVFRLLAEADFSDRARLRTLVLELKNDLRSSLVPAGQYYACLRAAGRLSPSLGLEERWQGVSQFLRLHGICRRLEEKVGEEADRLARLRSRVVTLSGLTVNLTASRQALPSIRGALAPLLARLPRDAAPIAEARAPRRRDAQPRSEGIASAASVGFVARAVPGPSYGSREGAQAAVLSQLLGTGFLWERVRTRGGAYGAYASAGGLEPVLTFSSYRDPNISETLAAFREALVSLRAGALSEDQVEKSIIGTVGQEERPLDPYEAGSLCLRRALYGVSDAIRQGRREEILRVTRAELMGAAERLLACFEEGYTVVLAGRRALEQAGPWESLFDLPD